MLSPLVVAQVTGVKVITSPSANAITDDNKEAALRPIRDMSWRLALIKPPTDTLEIMYPPQNSFIEQTADMLFTFLAGSTGYPKEAWRGNQVGVTQGAKSTERKILEIHKTIQRQATPYVKKSLTIQSLILGYNLPSDFKIGWRFKESMSESQEADLKVKQGQAVPNLGKVMTGNEIRELLDLIPLDYFDDTVPLEANNNKTQQGSDININGLIDQMNNENMNNQNMNINGEMNNESESGSESDASPNGV